MLVANASIIYITQSFFLSISSDLSPCAKDAMSIIVTLFSRIEIKKAPRHFDDCELICFIRSIQRTNFLNKNVLSKKKKRKQSTLLSTLVTINALFHKSTHIATNNIKFVIKKLNRMICAPLLIRSCHRKEPLIFNLFLP